jgi:DNA polymerase/3'-5' exonuclease PolX
MTSLEKGLAEIYSIGEKKAKKLIKEFIVLGILTKEQTKEEFTDDRVRKLLKDPKIYPSLDDATRVDLDEHPLRIIPREIISRLEKELIKIWDAVRDEGKPVPKYEIAGSYLRGKDFSGDIDFVLSTFEKPDGEQCTTDQTWDYFQSIVNEKSTFVKIHIPFARGSSKVDSLFELNLPKKPKIKVDTFLTTPDEYVFARLFAIGSGKFNIRMRATAKRKGYLLNQKGLFKKVGENYKKLPLKTEEDIFAKLNMHHRSPQERIS